LNAERAESDPHVFTAVNMIYHLRGKKIPEKMVQRLVEHSHAKYCSVGGMVGKTAEISWSIEISEM
jgi:putative redox protein